MDRSLPQSAAGDRLSTLQGSVLGRILSFLPSNEAARAALLSSRWRNVFAGVDTVDLEEPESPIQESDDYNYGSPSCHPRPDPNRPPPFSSTVSAALLARYRRTGVPPLHKLRVAMEEYLRRDSNTFDQWVSYAVQQAAPEGFHLDLRLRCRRVLCPRHYTLHRAGQGDHDQNSTSALYGHGVVPDEAVASDDEAAVGEVENPQKAASTEAGSCADTDDDSSVLSDDDGRKKDPLSNYKSWWELPEYTYTITRTIFSCTELRSLSLSFCQLAPPTNISMPSLEALLLSHVSDAGSDIEQLISGSPRLTDLTLEACDVVTALSVLGGVRLHRMAIRCCHNLATVAIDLSELQAFEYRGAVPDDTFLTLHSGSPRVVYCKVDICGEEVSSEDDVIRLRKLLQQFANARYLHLESARLGMGLENDVPTMFPNFSSLHHLELRGCLPNDDTTVITALSRILEHAPNLRALSLFFHPEKDDRWNRGYFSFKEGDILDAHHISYNPHSMLAVPCAAIPCLRSHVKEINLVHYQGGKAQRTLAKFLLSNSPVMEELFCEIAVGPLWTQTQLMCEIKCWVVNRSANIRIS